MEDEEKKKSDEGKRKTKRGKKWVDCGRGS
jgi:hypothetical protein